MSGGPALRGALAGFGRVAEAAHLPAFRARPELALEAVAEADPARRQAAAAALPGARLYPTLDALLAHEKGLDFAVIATPPHLHAPLSRQCLAAGLHVLCEKPLALSPEELEAAAAEAARADRALFPVHNWKKAPLLAKLKELLDSGAAGPVSYAEWHVLRMKPAADAGGGWRLDPRRSGGGVVMDHGWHAFYLVPWLLGRRPGAASALLSPAAGAEEEATVLMDLEDASAVVHLSWRAARRGHRGLFRGPEGSVEVGDDSLVLRRGDGPAQSYVFAEPLSRGSAHPEWLRDLLPDFRAAVLDPALRAAALDEARGCARLTAACYAAQPAPPRRPRKTAAR